MFTFRTDERGMIKVLSFVEKQARTSIVPSPYEDELLYSVMARMWHYTGRPPLRRWHGLLFGVPNLWTSVTLPKQIERISAALDAGPAFSPEAILTRMSLFNYFASFAPPEGVRNARRAAMGEGAAPHVHLGVNAQLASRVARLRFCTECVRDWKSAGEDARWVRLFQLPTTLVCPAHDVVLRYSQVSGLRAQGFTYWPANSSTCPPNAEAVAEGVHGKRMLRLRSLAEAGARLLATPHPPLEPDAWATEYRGLLQNVGLVPDSGKYRSNLLSALEDHWDGCLEYWGAATTVADNGRSRPWPIRLICNRTGGTSPVFHLLLNDYLIELEQTKRRPTESVASRSWRCENRVARHSDPFCISRVVRKRARRGEVQVHAHCDECGYVYSTWLRADGSTSKATPLVWGRVAEKWVIERTREGRSPTWIAKQLGASRSIVFGMAERAGLDPEEKLGWRRPEQVPMAVRASRPRSIRKGDFIKHPRDRAKVGRKVTDWASLDVELSAKLPSIIDGITRRVPPIRVTGALIATQLGYKRKATLERGFSRMPRSAEIWNASVETPIGWAERRRAYAVASLLLHADMLTGKERERLLKVSGVRATLRSIKLKAQRVSPLDGI